MKVVIDTNIVVSAALRDRLPEEIVLFACDHPVVRWLVTEEILDEYCDVLARPKFGLSAEMLTKWNELLVDAVEMIDPDDTQVEFPRDAGDSKFIQCAIAGDADYLITGDKDFEEAVKLFNTTVISAGDFKRLICDVWDN